MPNNYYNFSPSFVPFTKVRSDQANAQFQAIETAFDNFPSVPGSLPTGRATLGVESGSGNLFVVTMPNTRVANTNGDEIVFRATHANTGPATLQVDAIGAVSLRRFNGDPLVADDIQSGLWYTVRYDSATGRFVIVSPAIVTVAGAISYAAPSALVGLAAVNGVSTNVMRSDSAPALDQGITPTWTGAHIFNAPVTFNSTVSGAVFSSAATFVDGSAAAPGIAFTLDTNTGFYRIGADNVGLSTGGTLRWDVSTSAVTSTLPYLNAAGSAAAPAYSFSGDPNSGLYSVAADELGLSAGGTVRFGVSTTALTGTVPFLSPNGAVGSPGFSFASDSDSGIYWLSSGTFGFVSNGARKFSIDNVFNSTNDGSAAAPVYTWESDTNTGLYRAGSDDMRLVAGGSLGIQVISTGAVIFGYPGAVTDLGYTFQNDTDTGFYRVGANQIGFAAGGVLIADVQSTNFNFRFPGQFIDGTASAPGITFGNDTDTGIYRVGSNSVGVTAANLFLLIVSPSGFGINVAPSGNFAAEGTFSNTALKIGGASIGTSGGGYSSVGYNWRPNGSSGSWNYDSADFSSQINFESGGFVFKSASSGSAGATISYTNVLAVLNGATRFQDGSATTPSLSFLSDTNTGIYRSASDIMAFSVGGLQILNLDNSSPFRIVAKARIEGADGSPSNPGFTFEADGNTGIYRTGGDTMGFSTGGTLRFYMDTVLNANANGSASAPVYTWGSDTNTGMYRAGADTLGFAAGGVSFAAGTASVFSMQDGIRLQLFDGTEGSPSIQWYLDTDTGFYRSGSNQFWAVVGAASVVRFGFHPHLYIPGGPSDGQTIVDIDATSSDDFGVCLRLTQALNGFPTMAFVDTHTTGSGTPSFGANKPGSSGSITGWLPILVDGNYRYIPFWS